MANWFRLMTSANEDRVQPDLVSIVAKVVVLVAVAVVGLAFAVVLSLLVAVAVVL